MATQIKEEKDKVEKPRVIARTRASITRWHMETDTDEFSCNSRTTSSISSSRWASPRVSAPHIVSSGGSYLVEIKILGFQSPNDLTVDYNLKHSYFLYPNETVRASMSACSMI